MSVPLPVGEGPRRFFVITVCFFMKPCYHRSEWGGSANFGLGSNPNHEVWTMARAHSFETMNLSELAGNAPAVIRPGTSRRAHSAKMKTRCDISAIANIKMVFLTCLSRATRATEQNLQGTWKFS